MSLAPYLCTRQFPLPLPHSAGTALEGKGGRFVGQNPGPVTASNPSLSQTQVPSLPAQLVNFLG